MAKTDTKASTVNLDDPNLDFDKLLNDITAGWEKEQIGFPPYWNPAEGKKFLGRVILKDEREPNFVRYVIEATLAPIKCQQGPADDAEEVIVKPGEYFTCSAYGALPLENFFGHQVLVTTEKKRKIPNGEDGQPRTLWVFNVKVDEPTKKALLKQRESERLALQAKRTVGLQQASEPQL